MLLCLKNKRKCSRKLSGKAFHVHFFFKFVVFYIDTSSKHYIAMNKDENKVKEWFFNNKMSVSVQFHITLLLKAADQR